MILSCLHFRMENRSCPVWDPEDSAAAIAAVAGVDAVVLVVGLTSEGVRPNDESEGHDRTSLLLPGVCGSTFYAATVRVYPSYGCVYN